MRWDRDVKVVRLLYVGAGTAGAWGSGAKLSAKTLGSGLQVSIGVADTQGYDRCRIEVSGRAKTAAAYTLTKLKIGFQSGANTLFASCTPFSGLTSGVVLSAKALRSGLHAVDFDLSKLGNRKRFMNCYASCSSTTSAICEVRAYLTRGERIPQATATPFGYSSYSQLS